MANNAKKQKTDHGDPTVSGEANDEGDNATQNPSCGGQEGDPDLNVPSSKNSEESVGVVYIDARPDDGGSNSVDAKPGSTADDNPASWQSVQEQNKNSSTLPGNTSMDATLP